jgi:hypothetical protein
MTMTIKLGDMPSYGRCSANDMLAAVADARIGVRDAALLTEIDVDRQVGHQMVPGINFNSLNRIISAFHSVPFELLTASDEVKSYLEGVTGIVEANSFETMCLWQRWKDNGKSWVSTGHGYGPKVGTYGDMPVCISLLTAMVEGQKILFVDPTSQVTDHRLIEAWLKANVPSALRKDGYLNKTDAMNFANAVSTAKELAA